MTPAIPSVTTDLPPGAKQRLWPPMSSTLISGKRDAVLFDTFITFEQAGALVDWVAASGKNLMTIYATQGHGDHFFGAGTVLERFPRARLVATPDVVKTMRPRRPPENSFDKMLEIYPDRINPGALWSSARGVLNHNLGVVHDNHYLRAYPVGPPTLQRRPASAR